jgi:hypothetical protein
MTQFHAHHAGPEFPHPNDAIRQQQGPATWADVIEAMRPALPESMKMLCDVQRVLQMPRFNVSRIRQADQYVRRLAMKEGIPMAELNRIAPRNPQELAHFVQQAMAQLSQPGLEMVVDPYQNDALRQRQGPATWADVIEAMRPALPESMAMLRQVQQVLQMPRFNVSRIRQSDQYVRRLAMKEGISVTELDRIAPRNPRELARFVQQAIVQLSQPGLEMVVDPYQNDALRQRQGPATWADVIEAMRPALPESMAMLRQVQQVLQMPRFNVSRIRQSDQYVRRLAMKEGISVTELDRIAPRNPRELARFVQQAIAQLSQPGLEMVVDPLAVQVINPVTGNAERLIYDAARHVYVPVPVAPAAVVLDPAPSIAVPAPSVPAPAPALSTSPAPTPASAIPTPAVAPPPAAPPSPASSSRPVPAVAPPASPANGPRERMQDDFLKDIEEAFQSNAVQLRDTYVALQTADYIDMYTAKGEKILHTSDTGATLFPVQKIVTVENDRWFKVLKPTTGTTPDFFQGEDFVYVHAERLRLHQDLTEENRNALIASHQVLLQTLNDPIDVHKVVEAAGNVRALYLQIASGEQSPTPEEIENVSKIIPMLDYMDGRAFLLSLGQVAVFEESDIDAFKGGLDALIAKFQKEQKPAPAAPVAPLDGSPTVEPDSVSATPSQAPSASVDLAAYENASADIKQFLDALGIQESYRGNGIIEGRVHITSHVSGEVVSNMDRYTKSIRMITDSLIIEDDRISETPYFPYLEEVRWALELIGSSHKALPQSLRKVRFLLLCNNLNLEQLPLNLTVGGDATIINSPRLIQLPGGMEVKGNFKVKNCNVASVPSMKVHGDLIFDGSSNNANIQHFGAAEIGGDLCFVGSAKLPQSFADGVRIGGKIKVNFATDPGTNRWSNELRAFLTCTDGREYPEYLIDKFDLSDADRQVLRRNYQNRNAASPTPTPAASASAAPTPAPAAPTPTPTASGKREAVPAAGAVACVDEFLSRDLADARVRESAAQSFAESKPLEAIKVLLELDKPYTEDVLPVILSEYSLKVPDVHRALPPKLGYVFFKKQRDSNDSKNLCKNPLLTPGGDVVVSVGAER